LVDKLKEIKKALSEDYDGSVEKYGIIYIKPLLSLMNYEVTWPESNEMKIDETECVTVGLRDYIGYDEDKNEELFVDLPQE
jgi:hypothetical protein